MDSAQRRGGGTQKADERDRPAAAYRHDDVRLYQPADKALRALGPAHPATCPRGFAAPSPERMARPRRLASDCPPRPPRGFAARVAAPEHTWVCEERKRRRGKPDARRAWGAGELRSPRTITGGVGNPPRVPITIVGRRQIEARMSLQEQMASRWSPAVSRVLYPRPLPRAGDGHSSGPPVAERLVRPTWNLVSTRATSAGKPRGSDSVLLQVGFAVPLPSPGERCAFTTPFHPCLTTRLPARPGGLFSVALSFESSRLAVNQHPAHGARTFLDGDERRRDHPPNSSGKPARV